MQLFEWFSSEGALTLIGGLIGTAWTLFKSTEWYSQRRRNRYEAAIEVLEAAVEETYRTYVAALKEGRSDGKLTPAERRRARQLARERAISIGRSRGVDVLRELGQELIDLWIARHVKKLKR